MDIKVVKNGARLHSGGRIPMEQVTFRKGLPFGKKPLVVTSLKEMDKREFQGLANFERHVELWRAPFMEAMGKARQAHPNALPGVTIKTIDQRLADVVEVEKMRDWVTDKDPQARWYREQSRRRKGIRDAGLAAARKLEKEAEELEKRLMALRPKLARAIFQDNLALKIDAKRARPIGRSAGIKEKKP